MTRRLTDWVMLGAADYGNGTPHRNRPEGDAAAVDAYVSGWRAAALDDLAARLARAKARRGVGS